MASTPRGEDIGYCDSREDEGYFRRAGALGYEQHEQRGAAIAPRKAAAGTSTCEVGAIAQQSAAASPAPEFTPIVLGAASGFASTLCVSAPLTARAAPGEYAAADARQPGVQHDPRLGGAVVPAEECGHNVPGCHAHRPEGKAEHSRERGRERKRSEKPPHFFIFCG